MFPQYFIHAVHTGAAVTVPWSTVLVLLRSPLNDAARPFTPGPPTPGLKIYPLCPDPPEATTARTQMDAEHAHKYPPE